MTAMRKHDWETPRWEDGKIVCACGATNSMTLLNHGAAPLWGSDGGPYVTYSIWFCVRCRRRWFEDDESDEWEAYEENGDDS